MLPKDPVILFSYLNTQLRDNYSSLDALCDDKDEDKNEILEIMKTAGYNYNESQNKFI